MSCDIGIRFSPIEEPLKNEEFDISRKHWAIVITPSSGRSRIVEAFGEGERGAVLIETTDLETTIPAFPLATYQGQVTDSDRVIQVHPMRNTQYSPCFNNSQHFAATFILLLQAYASDRRFTVTQSERMNKVLATLEESESQLYHSPNKWMQMTHFGKVSLAGAAFVTATAAAEATVATTIPATGILGWLGMTTTVMAPAVYAPIAAVIIPVAALAAVGGTVGYMTNANTWRRKSMYDDPRIFGFPYDNRIPLTRRSDEAPAQVEGDLLVEERVTQQG